MLTVDCRLLEIEDGEQILDVGCGEGRHSWEACKRYKCLTCALDVEEANLEKTQYIFRLMDREGQCSGQWGLIRADAMRLPFKDAAFDKIICSEVLEHLADDGQGIREMRRVLKDDGALAISVPSYLPEAICWRLSRGYHNKPGGHVRKYRASELMAALRQNNLSIYATRRKHALHSFYWVARCLFGIKNERAWLPSLFHRFLVWDIETKSKPVRLLEGLLNPPFSKSTVFYTRKNHIQGKGA
jgi:SAM-dependent methyltransferase